MSEPSQPPLDQRVRSLDQAIAKLERHAPAAPPRLAQHQPASPMRQGTALKNEKHSLKPIPWWLGALMACCFFVGFLLLVMAFGLTSYQVVDAGGGRYFYYVHGQYLNSLSEYQYLEMQSRAELGRSLFKAGCIVFPASGLLFILSQVAPRGKRKNMRDGN